MFFLSSRIALFVSCHRSFLVRALSVPLLPRSPFTFNMLYASGTSWPGRLRRPVNADVCVLSYKPHSRCAHNNPHGHAPGRSDPSRRYLALEMCGVTETLPLPLLQSRCPTHLRQPAPPSPPSPSQQPPRHASPTLTLPPPSSPQQPQRPPPVGAAAGIPHGRHQHRQDRHVREGSDSRPMHQARSSQAVRIGEILVAQLPASTEREANSLKKVTEKPDKRASSKRQGQSERRRNARAPVRAPPLADRCSVQV